MHYIFRNHSEGSYSDQQVGDSNQDLGDKWWARASQHEMPVSNGKPLSPGALGAT